MKKIKNQLIHILQGIIIGGGAILPGISGGVLCVLFGIYRPMMEVLAHPVKALPKNLRLFVPVAIGWGLGFWLFAKALDFVFTRYELFAVCLFIGLIAGTIPGLFRSAVRIERSRTGYVTMAAAFALVLGVLLWVRFGAGASISPNTWWYLFSGLLWGVSLVAPGMSSSSILISLSLYQPLTAGISALDPMVLLPWGFGLVVSALGLGRLMNWLFARHEGPASYGIVGVVAASTLAIVPLEYGSVKAGLICGLCFCAGFAVAWLMDRFDITGGESHA